MSHFMEEHSDSLLPFLHQLLTGNLEDVCETIFSACDPEGCGEITVVRLINYVEKEFKIIYDRSLWQELKIMLLLSLDIDQLCIRKESFNLIIKDWSRYVQDYRNSPSELQSDDSQFDEYLTPHSYCSDINSPVSSPENASFIRKQLEDKITDMERQRINLLDENNKLKALLKDNEEALQCLTSEHNIIQDNCNVLEKKLQAFKLMQKDFQELETTQQDQQNTIRELESQVKYFKKENVSLMKSNSSLQTYFETLKEEKTEAFKSSENLRKLLSEAKSDIFHMEHKFSLTTHKYETEKTALLEKLKDFENLVPELKSTVVFLKEKNSELEQELSKRKITYNQEPETCSLKWRFLDESLNDVGETLKLLHCEQESEGQMETETNLRTELQASGDICLSHKQLELEITDYQEKLEICSSELIERDKNLNFTSDVILKSTEILKLILNSNEELHAFSDEIQKIKECQYSGSYKLLVLDLYAELEKVAMMVLKLLKNEPYSSTKRDGQKEIVNQDNETQTASSSVHNSSSSHSDIRCWVHRSPEYFANGSSRSQRLHENCSCNNCSIADRVFEVSHGSNRVTPFSIDLINVATIAKVMTKEVDNAECSIDSTSDLLSIQESNALTSYSSSSSNRNQPLHILKFLLKGAINLIFCGGRIFKLLMFVFIFLILFIVTGKLIFECYLYNDCGCYDIGELLSPHIKLHHFSPPPV